MAVLLPSVGQFCAENSTPVLPTQGTIDNVLRHFWLPTWKEVGHVTGTWWVEARSALNTCIAQDGPHNKAFPSPNGNGAQGEDPTLISLITLTNAL